MTKPSLEHLIALHVPVRALETAILVAHPKSGGIDHARLLLIAHHHGGGQMLAEAMSLRLNIIGFLFTLDSTIVPPGSLSAAAIAEVLAALPLSIEDGAVQFDGDDLANRLRLACAGQGHA